VGERTYIFRFQCFFWLGVAVLASCLTAAQTVATGDSRTVTEPTIPTGICTVLTANQAAGSLNQTLFDTARINSAISNCSSGEAVELSASGSNNAFLTQPLSMKNGATLLIDAGVTLFASLDPADYGVGCGTITTSSTNLCKPLIPVQSNNESIMGYGTIDGQGGQYLVTGTGSYFTCPSPLSTPCTWWDIASEAEALGENQNNPYLVQVHSGGNSFTLYKVTLQNSPMFHVTGTGGNGFTAWGVKIVAPNTARNTDGIDPGPMNGNGSTNITITDSYISTGDDEIAIKGDYSISNVTISNNHLFTGHGMSIGSETNGGVNNVLVSNLVMNGLGSADHNGNGLRIKSAQTEGGTVSDVTYENVCIQNEYNPLVFNPFYASGSGSEYPYFESILLDDVHVYPGYGGSTPFLLEGYSGAYPMGMTLDNVQIDGSPGCGLFSSSNTSFTLGPDPVSFSSCLTGTGVTVTNGISDSNAAYTCPASAFVPLAGELVASLNGSAVSYNGGQTVTLDVILQAMIPEYAPPAGGTISILEGSTVVGSATVPSDNDLAYLLIPIAIGTPSAGQHTYTAQYVGDSSSNYSAGISFGSLTITVDLTATTTAVTHSPSSVTYGQAVTYTATVAPTTGPGTPTGTVTFTVDGVQGSPEPVTDGSATLPLSLPTGGTHTVGASYSGDSLFAGSSGSDSGLSVSPATPSVTVTGGPFTYDGNPHAADCSASANDNVVPGLCALTYNPGGSTIPVGAGTYLVTAVFSPGNTTDYNSSTGSGSIAITAATPALTLICQEVSYNGQAHSCTATATGVSGAVSGTWSYNYLGAATGYDSSTPPTDADTYQVSATFASGDPNYNSSTIDATLIIDQAMPVIFANCYPALYDNNAHGCMPLAVGVGTDGPLAGLGSIAGEYVGENTGSDTISPPAAFPSAADTYTVTLTWTPTNPNGNYASNTVNSQLLIAAPIGLMVVDPGALNIPQWPTGPEGAGVIPHGVAVDPEGDTFVADTANNAIEELDASGNYSVYASSGLLNPQAVVADSNPLEAGVIYIADTGNNAVEMFDGTNLTTLAGGLSSPAGIAMDLDGNLYVADTGNNLIKQVDTNGSGITSLIAGGGTGCPGQTDALGDGCPATQAAFSAPAGLATDANGNIYVADTGHNLVRQINVTTGMITAVAGTGSAGYAGDNGAATAAQLSSPTGIAVDPAANVYILDSGNQAVRVVSVATGNIQTFAGTPQTAGAGGADQGSVTALQLSSPGGIAMDNYGNVFVADTGNQRSVEINRNTITRDLGTVAIGSNGTAVKFTITNAGSGTMLFDKPWWQDNSGDADNPGGDFSFSGTSGGCQDAGSVAVGANCTVSIAYDPNVSNGTGVTAGVQESDIFYPMSDASDRDYEVAINVTGEPVNPIATTTMLSFSPQSPVYGQSASVTAVVTPQSGSAVPSGSVSFTVDSLTPQVEPLSGGQASLTLALNAGSHTVTALYSGDNTFGVSSASGSVIVAQVTTTVTISCPNGVTYDGAKHACTGSAGGESGSLTYSYTGTSVTGYNSATAPTAADTYTVTATFSSSNPNYSNGTPATGTLTIAQATPTVTVTCPTKVTYDTTAHSCSAAAKGLGGAVLTGSGSFTWSPAQSETEAGSYTTTATFISSNSNYNNTGSGEASWSIAEAAATVTVSCPTGVVYDGNAHSCSATANGIGGADISASGSFSWSPAPAETNVGSYTLTATFTGTAPSDYSSASGHASLSIAKATPSLVLTCNEVTYNGSPHACTGSATGAGGASVSGSWVYSPGTETHAGSYPVTGTFTSTNANYSSGGSASGTLQIDPATPTVTVSCPSGVTYDGNAHSCSATAKGIGGANITDSGSFTWSPAQSETAVGTYPLTATFNPTQSSDYGTASGSGTLTIAAAGASGTSSSGTPVPAITTVKPWHVAAGSTDTALTVSGTNFESGAVMQWNGANLTTTVNSKGTVATATVPAADLATVGTANITVYNPPATSAAASSTSPAFVFAIDTAASTSGAVTVTANTASVSVPSGGTANLSVTLGGGSSAADISVTCVNMPAGASCSYNNSEVAISTTAQTPAGSYAITVIFTATQTAAAALPAMKDRFRAGGFTAWMGIMGLPVGFLWMGDRRKKTLRRVLLALLGIVLLISLAGCGGAIQPSASNAASGATQTSVQVTLTVK